MREQRLTDLFLAHLPPSMVEQVGSADQLEHLLEHVVQLGENAWPDINLDRGIFLSFLAQRLPDSVKVLEEALNKLKVADLYLACAILQHIPQAVAEFESKYLPATQTALSRMETAALQIEDIQQVLYQKLLLGDTVTPPKLELYSGSGDLRGWLCVTAVRTALDLVRREKNSSPLDDSQLAQAIAPVEDQELQYLKRLYRQEFKAAFEGALAKLTSRERNILRYQLLDGLTLEQIGAIYNVHRATIARWNGRLREKLLSQTRQDLLARLKTSGHELESIMRLIQSQFDVSIRRYLDRKKEP